jgi:hypothetical protein
MVPENNRPIPLRRTQPATPGAAPGDVLLRVAASCPRCGTRPALRVTPAIVSALAGAEAGMRVGTYQCQRRGCGAIYDLDAEAYLRAG